MGELSLTGCIVLPMDEQVKTKAPGRSERQGITPILLLRIPPTDRLSSGGWWSGTGRTESHADKRMKAARGPVGKAVVTGVKGSLPNKVVAWVVSDTSANSPVGTVSHEHLDRYVSEFSHCHNERPHDTISPNIQAGATLGRNVAPLLRYEDLAASGVHAKRRMEIAA